MKSRKLLLLLPVLFFLASCSRDPKVQAQRYVENGNKFFEKGKFKEASIMYRRALQKDLRFGEAYYRLALTEIKLTAYGDAVRSLRRAVELQPDNSDAAVKLADIYLIASTQDKANTKEYLKEAKELSGKLVAKDAKSYDGHRLQGQIALLEKDAPRAVAELQTAMQLKPGQTDLAMAYFQALATNQQVDQAEKMALDVLRQAPDVRAHVRCALRVLHEHEEAHAGGSHHEAQGGEQSREVQLPGAAGGALSVHAAAG